MSANCGVVDSRSARSRSRVSNGRALFVGADGRSAWARRLRDLIVMHLADLGGEAAVSEAEKSIVRRAATLTVELERLEAKFAQAGAAEADELDLYQRAAGNLRRLLDAVGLKRRPKDVTPSLSEYLSTKAAETARGGAIAKAPEPAADGASGAMEAAAV